jgi:hypothetical protein
VIADQTAREFRDIRPQFHACFDLLSEGSQWKATVKEPALYHHLTAAVHHEFPKGGGVVDAKDLRRVLSNVLNGYLL